MVMSTNSYRNKRCIQEPVVGDWPIAPYSVDGNLAVPTVKFTESLERKFNSNSNGTDSAYSLKTPKMWNLPKPSSYAC